MTSEFQQVYEALAELGPWPLPADRPHAALEDAFLRDTLAHPEEAAPLLIFADWLEDHGDRRAAPVRLLARLRSLRRGPQPRMAEQFSGLWPAPPAVPQDFLHRFDDESRLAAQMAHQEAQRRNHEYAGTQHLLLAFARRAPAEWGLPSHGEVDAVVEQLTPTGPDILIMSKLPQTPRMKAVAHFAIEEAIGFAEEFVTPSHLLLGLCRTTPGLATAALRQLGVAPAAVCQRVLTRLGREPMRWLHGRPEVW
jgi:ATP-dependent Clp protease ATP-binding subunit ClpC